MVGRTNRLLPTRVASKVLEQLDRIRSSNAFRQADRLQRFLSFVVIEALAGRGDNLQESLIGIEVFGREANFDPAVDPIVRVYARRLRARLHRYYRQEGPSDEILIELPGNGYTPAFQNAEALEPQHSVASLLSSRNSIAVSRFVDDSLDQELEHLCASLTAELVRALTQARKFRVTPLLPAEDWTAAAALRITGSIRNVRDRLRITTHLVDAVNGYHLWSASFDWQADIALAQPEDVARSIVARMHGESNEGPL